MKIVLRCDHFTVLRRRCIDSGLPHRWPNLKSRLHPKNGMVSAVLCRPVWHLLAIMEREAPHEALAVWAAAIRNWKREQL